MVVDHINGDSLDNRINNLRLCYHRDNARNREGNIRLLNDFKFKGVTEKEKSFQAQFCLNQTRINLGRFETAADAAKVYDMMTVIFYGEYAKPNFESAWKFLKLRDVLKEELEWKKK
jgi:hypothetical protein